MVVPETGCLRSRSASNLSAGGQLEQPSEVKSSTSTALGAGCGEFEAACSIAFDAAARRKQQSRAVDFRQMEREISTGHLQRFRIA